MPASVMVPRAALAALLVLAFSNQPLAQVAGITIRPDWIAGALAAAVVAVALACGRRPAPSPGLLAFAVFVGFQVATSVAQAGTWPSGPKFSVIYVLALLYTLAFLVLLRDGAAVRWALAALLVIAVAEALYGVLSVLISNVAGVRVGGAGRQTARDFLSARGTMSERNLFSSLLLVPFTLALWRFGAAPAWSRSWFLASGALAAALVFGLTRAVWITAAGVLLVWAWWMRPRWTRAAAIGGVVVLSACLLAGTDWARAGTIKRTGVYDRVARGVVEGRDSPINTRVVQLRTGYASWRTAVWFGHGAGSANLLEQRVGRRRLGGEAWIGNASMFILHDAGIFGLLLWLTVPAAVAYEWWVARRPLAGSPLAADHDALLVGAAATLVAWQATHGLWQMYGYAFMAILLALCHVARREHGHRA
jgi:hypothetical protein